MKALQIALEGCLLLGLVAGCGKDTTGDTGTPLDWDNDGYVGTEDCDDSNPDIHPDATEYCDGIDNNCDNTVDEDSAVDAPTWYEDSDSDGYGNPSVVDVECNQPWGYVANSADCNDSDHALNSDDLDSDGFSSCDGDCDDEQSSIYPGATEYCDGHDDDCDGTIDEDDAINADTWYEDSDGDGYGDASSTYEACFQPTGYVADKTDCDDQASTIYPGAPEYCDEVDNDCDGSTDEDDALDALTWYRDGDGDGYGALGFTDVDCYQPSGFVADNTDCDDGESTTFPGADEYCDGQDDDCDGDVDEDEAVDVLTWYRDGDGDGYGALGFTDIDCYQPSGFVADNTDCDDTTSLAYPGADEYCDGIDNNCDNAVDEDTAVDATTWYVDSDSDGYGDSGVADVECNQPSGYVANSTDCNDSDATLNQDDSDSDGYSTCDGDCDDSDSAKNLLDADTDGYSTCDGDCDDVDATMNPADADLDGFSTCDGDCNDSSSSAYPGATEYCDGIDNNCDNAVDEDSAVDVTTWYVDSDADGYGDSSLTDLGCNQPSGYVANSSDCNDSDSSLNEDDLDSDGYSTCDGDCDDADASLDPADADLDGFSTCDDDCDDADASLNPADADLDGFSTCDDDCDDSDVSLDPADDDGDGYSTCDGDCDDTDAALNLDDSDADGYSTCDGDCDDNLNSLVDCSSCSAILSYAPNSPDGLYDVNYGDGDVEVYCDMTGGGDTIENFGFGKYTGSYSGWELMDHNEFTEFAISDAMSHFYNQNGGLENIDVGFNSSNCCIVSADLTGGPYYGFDGLGFMYPANSDGSKNCNATYNDSYMLLGDFYGGGTGAFMTLSQSEVQNVNTSGACTLRGNPGIFIQRWR